MKTISIEHLRQLIDGIAAKDPELHEEIRNAAPESQEALNEYVRLSGAPEQGELEDGSGRPTSVGRAVLETIVQPARPVMLIQNNKVTSTFLGPDSQVWGTRVRDAASVLNRVIPSVGRVEVDNHPDYSWLGTGWVIDDAILVTNRHVAQEFARAGSMGFVFRSGLAGKLMGSTIDFLEEYDSASKLTFIVDSVLWIAPGDQPDVAFLRLRGDAQRTLPRPLVLGDAPQSDVVVATIGYPARDSRIPDQDLVRSIFGDVYEKKRLAPGQVREVNSEEIQHDCSTLGGNSGSPVVDLMTGKVFGLHFSGIFRQANYAVASPRLAELLRGLRNGDLSPVPSLSTSTAVEPAAAVVQVANNNPAAGAVAGRVPTSGVGGEYVSRFCLPVEVVLRFGAPIEASLQPSASPFQQPTTAFGAATEVQALSVARASLSNEPDVLDVRLGYRFRRGWITDERVIVVEVANKKSLPDLQAIGKTLLPNQFLGFGVDVRTAALPRQLERLGVRLPALEARGGAGLYREPPNLSLDRVQEDMHAVFHVSPDSGFPNLKAFFERVRGRVTATMYEWGADYISDAIEAAMKGRGHILKMVTQKSTSAGGTAAAVDDMRQRIGNKFQHVWASVGAGCLFPSAYHIKVASRDEEEFWLSSGNFKESNQPNIDPVGDHTATIGPLRKFNRDWHVTIQNATLAKMFQAYIEYDFEEAQRVPLEETIEPRWPDVFIPEKAFFEALERPEVKYFTPLELQRELDVQPLLTPDHTTRDKHLFITHAIEMVKDAQSRIFVQNQSFSLLQDGNNQAEFELFFKELVKKQQQGLDVRVIFRDPREFSAGNDAPLQEALERLKDFGFDTGRIKVQKHLHCKGLIIDETEVLLGSQNLTNAGALFNRDASLRVRDPEVTRYFAEIFLYDWDVLADQSADEAVGGIQLAPEGSATPPGFRRISTATFFGED